MRKKRDKPTHLGIEPECKPPLCMESGTPPRDTGAGSENPSFSGYAPGSRARILGTTTQQGGIMQHTIARGASFLCAVALLAAAATPASAAGPPPGKGLTTFGTYTCEGGLGEVDLVGPRGDKAASVFTSTGEHLNLLSLEIVGSFEGNPVDISKTYGQKSALTTFTCTQHFADEEDQTIIDVTLLVGLVPPQ
jgi:hypothetical protein